MGAQQAEAVVELHRTEPAVAAIDVDDGKREAARAAIGARIQWIARKAGKHPEAPARGRRVLDAGDDPEGAGGGMDRRHDDICRPAATLSSAKRARTADPVG